MGLSEPSSPSLVLSEAWFAVLPLPCCKLSLERIGIRQPKRFGKSLPMRIAARFVAAACWPAPEICPGGRLALVFFGAICGKDCDSTLQQQLQLVQLRYNWYRSTSCGMCWSVLRYQLRYQCTVFTHAFLSYFPVCVLFHPCFLFLFFPVHLSLSATCSLFRLCAVLHAFSHVRFLWALRSSSIQFVMASAVPSFSILSLASGLTVDYLVGILLFFRPTLLFLNCSLSSFFFSLSHAPLKFAFPFSFEES